ncbi:accessory factor UbiK family protein [Candidatus Curculioniphilus buchneri]|uniref:accessory factor UbiK family protein n=1 Tax=Candidatus Curculioniphilus buchneri TaxID=690594 RepID=UPI00376EEB6D
MFDLNKLGQIARQIQESLPKSFQDLDKNIEIALYQILKNQFNRMHLVSREEFDTQHQILLHICEKFNQIEVRINAIETILKDNVVSVQPKCEDKSVDLIEDEVKDDKDNNNISIINNSSVDSHQNTCIDNTNLSPNKE